MEGVMSSPSGEDDDFIIVQQFAEEGVTLIRERHYISWNLANIWIVQGATMDLIVDTGIGLWDLPSFLRAKKLIGANKPCLAVATHVHFDHAGGLHQFDDVAIHAAEASALKNGDSYEACCFMSRRECGKPPAADWKPRDYKLRPATPTRVLEDGDEIDLGDRQFKAIHLPGHSRGSIGLYDEKNGTFFSGDVIYRGPMLDILPFGNVAENRESIETIAALTDGGRVKRVCPGHLDPFDGEELKTIAADYLKAFGTCHDCTACICKPLLRLVLKGRNTKEPCPRCCYYSCCCCMCL